jgi:hypothetical protein
MDPAIDPPRNTHEETRTGSRKKSTSKYHVHSMGRIQSIEVIYNKRKTFYTYDKGHSTQLQSTICYKYGPIHKGPTKIGPTHKGPSNPEAKGQQIGASRNGTIYIHNIRKKHKDTAAPTPSRGDLGLPPTSVRKLKWVAETDIHNSEKIHKRGTRSTHASISRRANRKEKRRKDRNTNREIKRSFKEGTAQTLLQPRAQEDIPHTSRIITGTLNIKEEITQRNNMAQQNANTSTSRKENEKPLKQHQANKFKKTKN